MNEVVLSALMAMLWGGVAGFALLIGALVGFSERMSNRTVSLILALGGGVLIAMVALELMQESFELGGYWASGVGVLGGSTTFFLADLALAHYGGKRRKQSEGQPETEGSGYAIFVGSLLDSIPEAVAIGVSLLKGGSIGWVLILGVLLSNIPEGLSATTGMLKAGRSLRYVFGLWSAATLATALAALFGYLLFAYLPIEQVALTQSFAAGAILAMLASSVFPQAFKQGGPMVGLLTSIGFLIAFFLSKID